MKYFMTIWELNEEHEQKENQKKCWTYKRIEMTFFLMINKANEF